MGKPELCGAAYGDNDNQQYDHRGDAGVANGKIGHNVKQSLEQCFAGILFGVPGLDWNDR